MNSIKINWTHSCWCMSAALFGTWLS